MSVKLTDQLVKATKPGTLVYDRDYDGLAVRGYPSGKISFLFESVISGKRRRVVIGSYPSWSLEAARQEAATYRVTLDKGGDPFAIAERKHTLRDVYQRFERDYLPKLSTRGAADIQSMWNRIILPAIGDKPVDAINFNDVEKLHKGISAPYAANRTVETLRRVLNLAIKWGLIERNAAKGLELNIETARQTFLNEAQIVAILRSLPNTSAGDLIHVLFYTGCRVDEVRTLRWEHVDLNNGIWTKPPSTTKQKRVHRVMLSDAALAVVARQPKRSQFVFSREDGTPIKDIRKTWLWAFKRAGAQLGAAALQAVDEARLERIGRRGVVAREIAGSMEDDHAVQPAEPPAGRAQHRPRSIPWSTCRPRPGWRRPGARGGRSPRSVAVRPSPSPPPRRHRLGEHGDPGQARRRCCRARPADGADGAGRKTPRPISPIRCRPAGRRPSMG